MTDSRLRRLGFRAAVVASAAMIAALAVFIVRDATEELPPPLDAAALLPAAPVPAALTPTAPMPVETSTNAVTNAVVASTNAAPKVLAAPTNAASVATVKARTFPTNVPPARQVRLANRTRVLEKYRRPFPKQFAARQTPTTRGTAPYIVVSELQVSDLVRERATKLGARVLGFMPVNSLVVEIDAKTLKKFEADVLFSGAYELEPVDKVQRRVWEQSLTAPTVDVTIVPLATDDLATLWKLVEEKGGTPIEGAGDAKRSLRATVPAKLVDELAGRGEVRWIEAFARPQLQNDVAVNRGLMNVREVWDAHGLDGTGQIVSISDSGLDTGNLATLHADFSGRVLGINTISYAVKPWQVIRTVKQDTNGHGTHTAGSIVGTGAESDGDIKGVAYGAQLFMTAVSYNGYIYFNDFASLFQPSARYQANIHSASWCDTGDNSYSDWCEEVDDYVWNHPDFLPVFCAGNAGDEGAGTVGTPGTAKNCLTVGATESLRPGVYAPTYADNVSEVAYFSSKGPTADGRIKPEICAPGSFILSTRSTLASSDAFWSEYSANGSYAYNGGTSMACPLVAGAAALTRQWLVLQRGYDRSPPTAALLKAVLTGGAHDMAEDVNADCGGAAPNHRQGWGRIDLAGTLFPSGLGVRLEDRIPFAVGSDQVFHVTVTNAAPLDVQLAWIDHPATAGAASALVNDLDLVVSNETTGVVWLGNGVEGGDHTNNLESVRIASAAPGRYAIHVKGTAVPYDSTTGGAAALYLRGALAETGSGGEQVYPLRRQSYFPLLDDWGSTVTTWYPSGTVVRVSVPRDLPDGEETLTGLVWTDDATGVQQELDPQRLAEIEVAPADGVGEFRYDAQGRMAVDFDVVVDSARDVRFRYYSETNFNGSVQLPDWWWRRNLRGATGDGALGWSMGDADGDGVANGDEYRADTDPLDAGSNLRILAFSPTNLVWRGGRECTQVVERATGLGRGTRWTGVFTNCPPTATEGACALPPPAGPTNWFYRVRVQGR